VNEEGSKRVGGVALIVAGALWVALTGTCTGNVLLNAEDIGPVLGVFGVPIVSIGLLPIAFGLEFVLARGRAGRALMILAVSWIVAAVALLVLVSAEGQIRRLSEVVAILVLGVFCTAVSIFVLMRGRRLLRDGG
jgi:hypothetical protein